MFLQSFQSTSILYTPVRFQAYLTVQIVAECGWVVLNLAVISNLLGLIVYVLPNFLNLAPGKSYWQTYATNRGGNQSYSRGGISL